MHQDPAVSSLRMEKDGLQSSPLKVEKCRRFHSPGSKKSESVKSTTFCKRDASCRKGLHPHTFGTVSDTKKTLAQTFMQEVPDEILDVILVYAVRGHKDMRSLALTCKHWRIFAEQDLSWKRLSIRGWGNRADIIQIPIEKDAAKPWNEYYKTRILSHLPELCYMKHQQHLTVKTMIQTNELQMIGAACAVISLNSDEEVEDIDAAYFERASFFTDGACTAKEIVETSRKICDVLALRTAPKAESACLQIDSLLSAMQKNYSSSSTYCLSHYLGELALQAEASLKYSPQLIGTASYALACHTLGWSENIWMPLVRTKSPFPRLAQLQPCMLELQGLLRQALGMLTRRSKKVNVPHVIVKYSRRERQHVAKVIVTPTAWPTICPHGRSREAPDCGCDACRQDDASAVGGDAALLGEETMHAHGQSFGPGYHMLPGSRYDLEEEEEEEHDGLSGFEGAAGAAHTPGESSAASAAGAAAAQLQRAHDAADAPAMVVFAAAGGAGVLTDESFGAVSESNDNSFVAAADAPFLHDDGPAAAPADRRASLSALLRAVDEEPPAAGGGGGTLA